MTVTKSELSSGRFLAGALFGTANLGKTTMSAARRWVSFLAALPLLAIGAEKSAAIVDDIAYTRPQRLIAIEPDRRLNIYVFRPPESRQS